jgi:hypothetical protein
MLLSTTTPSLRTAGSIHKCLYFFIIRKRVFCPYKGEGRTPQIKVKAPAGPGTNRFWGRDQCPPALQTSLLKAFMSAYRLVWPQVALALALRL